MNSSVCFEGDTICLRTLDETDVNADYLSWLSDYDVVKYTESRFSTHTLESLKNFVEHANNDNNKTFAIIEKEGKKHIGNIKLGNINWIHRYADIGLIIGNRNYWGKGIATKAIKLVVDYAFKTLELHKITAGIYINNTGSLKAFEKAGFIKAYVENKKYLYEGKYIDSITVEMFNEQKKND